MTKSYKHGGYCVAGIDCYTGTWIRLVSNDAETEGAVPERDLIYQNGSSVSIYDIIDCEVCSHCPSFVQPENWQYDGRYYWNKVGVSNLKEVINCCGLDDDDFIFCNTDRRLPADWQFASSKSLCLAQIHDAYIEVCDWYGKKVYLNFAYKGRAYQHFSISQTDIYRVLINKPAGVYKVPSDIVVFSLTDKYSLDGRYYKMVAQFLL